MGMKNQFKKLNDFGLNKYESKIWVALLSKGTSTAGELSNITNVPRSRSYDVLESLEKKGFVLSKGTKPSTYNAIKPDLVIKNAKNKILIDTNQKIRHLQNLKMGNLFKELEKIYDSGLNINEQSEFVSYINGEINISNQLNQMIKNCKNYIYIVVSENDLNSKIKNLNKVLVDATKKGVEVKIMAYSDNENIQGFECLKIKKTSLRSRFFIVDGNEMLLMLLKDLDAGILVNTRVFIESVIDLFIKQWENSEYME